MNGATRAEEIKAEPTASIRIVRALAEAVAQAGVPRLEFLRRIDVTEADVNQVEARLSYSQIWHACETAMDVTGDPALGLHWAERHVSQSFLPVSDLVLQATSLRDGLTSLAQFERLLSDEPNFRLVEQSDRATLRFTPALQRASADMKRFAADMMMASFNRILRAFGPQAAPFGFAFEHAAPAYRAEYCRVLGESPVFSQPHNDLTFESTLLDAPSPFRDADVQGALLVLAKDRIDRLEQGGSYALRVRDHLVKQGWREDSDMGSVARSLGLSVRSLRRRLEAEGKSYLEVENEAFATVANHLLRERHFSIQETAFEMGFSNTSTFHRAFKRWTGTTPSASRGRRRTP